MKIHEGDIEYYTNGCCWSLAWQIYRILNRDYDITPTIVTVGYDKGDWKHYEDWCHVLVKVGDKYLDVEGLHSRRQIRNKWGNDVVEHGPFKTFKQYKKGIAPVGFGIEDTYYRHTVELAYTVIERYLP